MNAICSESARTATPFRRESSIHMTAQFGGVRLAETNDHFLIGANWATRSGEAARLAIRDAREFHGINIGFNGRSHLLPKGSVKEFCRVLADDQRPSVAWMRQVLSGEQVTVPSSAAYTMPELTSLAQISPASQQAVPNHQEISLFSAYGIPAPSVNFELPVADDRSLAPASTARVPQVPVSVV